MHFRLLIPEHPIGEHELLAPDPVWLETTAHESGAEDPIRFLFGTLPCLLFDEWLSGGDPGPRGRWALALSGWFGGVWLRRAIVAAQPQSALLAMSVPVDAVGVAQVTEAARAGAEISAEVAIAHCEAELPGWVAGFGYNRGYLEEILATPPAGATPMPNFMRVESPLWCEYRIHPLACLDRLWAVAQRSELSEGLAASFDESLRAGHEVWSAGLSVESFSAAEYATLLDLSARFLAVVHATLLTALAAVDDADTERGVRAARAGAALGIWTGSYALALRDPGADGAPEAGVLPRFED